MNVKCSCGGTFRRTDIKPVYSGRYGKTLYTDTDPVKCNWRCPRCGEVRTQRKRLPACTCAAYGPATCPRCSAEYLKYARGVDLRDPRD
jgi:hypothetical protein